MLWEGQMRLFFRPSSVCGACFGSSEIRLMVYVPAGKVVFPNNKSNGTVVTVGAGIGQGRTELAKVRKSANRVLHVFPFLLPHSNHSGLGLF